jgi:hypothetical protein
VVDAETEEILGGAVLGTGGQEEKKGDTSNEPKRGSFLKTVDTRK